METKEKKEKTKKGGMNKQRVLAFLVSSYPKLVSVSQISSTVFAGEFRKNNEIWNIIKLLKIHGTEIEKVWGRGYRLKKNIS
jgi:biotin operon repressor